MLSEGVIVTRGSSEAFTLDSAVGGGVACCGEEEAAEAILGRSRPQEARRGVGWVG